MRARFFYNAVITMRSVRAYVFLFTAAAALALYAGVRGSHASADLQAIRLAEVYGAMSLVLLYLAMAVSPLYSVFPALAGRALLFKARRALGVCAFLLGLAHTWVAFFKLLAGWEGLAFLPEQYLQDVLRSAAALAVLLVLAATSNDWAVARLGKTWKSLHRLLYVAAPLIVLHTVLLGSHYVSRTSPALVATFVLVAVLFVLEGMRLDRWMARHSSLGNLGAGLSVTIFGVAAAAAFLFFSENGGLSIHSTHPLP